MHREGGGAGLGEEAHSSLQSEHTTSNVPARNDDSADHPLNLSSWVQNTGKRKAIPQRGLTTYGRLEKTSKVRGRDISEEAEKGIWEFNLLSQDPGVAKASASKGNAKKSTSILKSSRAKRQDLVGDEDREVHEISNKEGEEGWGNKEAQTGCKKVTPIKSITSRRSKSSMVIPVDDGTAGVEPVVYGDDENDDDYNPVRTSRKTKKKVTMDPPVSSGRKKTRSNTDDWELMPALPKGRKSAVLKQLATGFEFDKDSMTLKGAAKTRTRSSASASPLRNNPPLSPFKVDLARDSLILPEEEKGKYHVFSPTPADAAGVDSLLPGSSEEPSSVELPQLPSCPQEMIESIVAGTGTYMSSAVPGEECLGLRDKASKEKESEGISLSSVTPRAGRKKSKLGSRSKTLAEMLDVEADKAEEDGGQGVANMTVSGESSFQSPTRKRVRLKQARGKTVLAPSPDKMETEHNNDLTMPTSPVGLRKEPDDDSPLSELDEGTVMSPRRLLDNSGLMRSRIHDQIILGQEASILSNVSDSLKPKQLVPKAGNRKRSDRNTSKISLDEDSTHDGDDLPTAEVEAQPKPRKLPIKRRKKSRIETTDTNEQSLQLPPAVIPGDITSNEERSTDSLLPTTATSLVGTKRKASKTGKGNKKMENSEGSTNQLDGQELRVKVGVEDSEPDKHDIGGPLHPQISTPKGQSIGTGRERSLPSTPVLGEPAPTPKQPKTPQPAKPVTKNPHSPINGGKPPPIKFRVGLSRRANIEPLHGYLKK